MRLLRLLGSPQFEQGEQILPLGSVKPLMLLAYLACKSDWVSRDELSELIWPEANSSTRSGRFRQMIHYIREQVWSPELEVERLRLRWAKGSDVHELLRAFAEGDWLLATRLLRGPLLSGISLDEQDPFGRWLLSERQKHRTLWLEAARKAAAGLEEQGRLTEALEVWEAILKEDGLAETALCELLRLCLSCGQYARGFAAYTAFQQRLWREHHLEPHQSTHAWLERLHQAAGNVQANVPATSPQTPTVQTAFPEDILPGTPFVGRETELAELVKWLDAEGSGVLTLFGPGGVGKTRLAIEATRRTSCPSVFVPLVSLLKGQSVIAAVAQALGKPLRSVHTAEQELKAQLQSSQQVLILDNAEHLIEEVKLLALLLNDCAEVKLLVTSRLRLGLEGEQVVELGGLSLEPEPSAQSPALSLLFHLVRRSRPGFAWSPHEAEVASRICHALDGVPLALELAGGWARLFSLSEIAERIEQKLDFLEGSLDTPERHRGLRVVFAHSWQLLSEWERKALCRLAVFEEGFEVGAGLEVAQASETDLLALVDKALLRIVGETYRRGDIHPLILEYAREQLTPNQRGQTLERHAHYFLRLAEEASSKLNGPEQVEWLDRLNLEHPNLRLALQWWMESGNAGGALKFASALRPFWYVRGFYREGVEWLERAIALPGAEEHQSEYADALRCAGALWIDLSEYPRAQQLLLDSLALWQQLDQPAGMAHAQHHLGFLMREQGDMEQARHYLQASIAIRRTLGDLDGLSNSISNLAITVALLGEVEQARSLFEESLTLAQAVGNDKNIAHAYQNLGIIAHMQKRPFEEFQPLYEKSLALKRKLGDLQGAATTLHNLGELAVANKDPSARGYLGEALVIRQKLGNRNHIARTLLVLAKLLVSEGELEKVAAMYGFLQRWTEQLGFANNKEVQPGMDALRETIEQNLGSERAAVAQATGAMLSLEQAIKLAGLEPR